MKVLVSALALLVILVIGGLSVSSISTTIPSIIKAYPAIEPLFAINAHSTPIPLPAIIRAHSELKAQSMRVLLPAISRSHSVLRTSSIPTPPSVKCIAPPAKIYTIDGASLAKTMSTKTMSQANLIKGYYLGKIACCKAKSTNYGRVAVTVAKALLKGAQTAAASALRRVATSISSVVSVTLSVVLAVPKALLTHVALHLPPIIITAL